MSQVKHLLKGRFPKRDAERRRLLSIFHHIGLNDAQAVMFCNQCIDGEGFFEEFNGLLVIDRAHHKEEGRVSLSETFVEELAEGAGILQQRVVEPTVEAPQGMFGLFSRFWKWLAS